MIDFKQMPKNQHSYNNALVMVNRLGKQAWTIPYTVQAISKNIARIYYKGPFRVFGIPATITSNKRPQFISAFIDKLYKLIDITHTLALAGHHKTVKQAEIINKYLD